MSVSRVNRLLDSPIAWGVIALSSAALAIGGALGHSHICVALGMIEGIGFNILKGGQLYYRWNHPEMEDDGSLLARVYANPQTSQKLSNLTKLNIEDFV